MQGIEPDPARWRLADTVVLVVLAVLVAGGSWQRSALLHPAIYQYATAGVQTTDMWFDADIPRDTCMTTNRFAEQHKAAAVHPLLSSAYYVPGRVLRAPGDASAAVTTMRRIAALYAMVWMVCCYALYRAMGNTTVAAAIFAALAAVSSAGMFWTAVPEVHLLASSTLMLPLIVVGLPARYRGATWLTVASAASLSITVTNWMSGLAAALLERGWRRGTQIAVNAFVAVSVLWSVQALWFPRSTYFLGNRSVVDVVRGDGPTVVSGLMAWASHSVVMPLVGSVARDGFADGRTVQDAAALSSGPLGAAATAMWWMLLAWGIVCVVRTSSSLRKLLVITLIGQLALHLRFGSETFLYSAQFAPLLIAVAAFGALGRNRRAILTLTVALIVVAGTNNWQQFQRAAGAVNTIGTALAERGELFLPADVCQ